MRYNNIDNVIFRNSDGKSYTVKDLREIPTYTTRKTITIIASDMADEIASRDDIYGDFGEDQTYKIFEANLIPIFEAKFDLTQVRSLVIPV